MSLSEGNSERFHTMFSAFGGMGIGSAEGHAPSNIDNSILNRSVGDFYKYWFQPSFGVVSENFEFLFSTRVNYVDFTTLKNDLRDNKDNINVSGRHSNWFYEPVVTIKAGGNRVKGVFQSGFSMRHYLNSNVTFRNRPFILNLGVQIHINNRK